jgi:hypothetical protein
LPNLEDEIEGARECLEGLTWAEAWGCFDGTGDEPSEHAQAASLARRLDARMEDTLKRSARITAIALNLHSPGLMDDLVEAWTHLREEGWKGMEAARDEYRRPGDELRRKQADGSPVH